MAKKPKPLSAADYAKARFSACSAVKNRVLRKGKLMNVCNLPHVVVHEEPGSEPEYSFRAKCPEPLKLPDPRSHEDERGRDARDTDVGRGGYYDYLEKGYVCGGNRDKDTEGQRHRDRRQACPVGETEDGGRFTQDARRTTQDASRFTLHDSRTTQDEEADYIRGCKQFFEEDLLPITDPHIGPGGRYYLPPSLIRDYRAIFEIVEKRERGFVRLLEVLKRYQEKLRTLDAELILATENTKSTEKNINHEGHEEKRRRD